MPSPVRPFDIRADLERRVLADLVRPADGDTGSIPEPFIDRVDGKQPSRTRRRTRRARSVQDGVVALVG